MTDIYQKRMKLPVLSCCHVRTKHFDIFIREQIKKEVHFTTEQIQKLRNWSIVELFCSLLLTALVFVLFPKKNVFLRGGEYMTFKTLNVMYSLPISVFLDKK